ncbi:MAG TPA: hypothetical protein PK867_24330, partial [Pirellulales bacterium]|nr:hypothetical protein [Pirellulales bacterium]
MIWAIAWGERSAMDHARSFQVRTRRGTIMMELPPLNHLFIQAEKVFSFASEVGEALMEERRSTHVMLEPHAWQRHAPRFEQFCEAILALRHAMVEPPNGFEAVAVQLKEAARIAKAIRDANRESRGWNYPEYLDFFPDLNSVACDGRQAVNQAKKLGATEDPFAFLITLNHDGSGDQWCPRLPAELRGVKLISLCLTTPPAVTEHIARLLDGRFFSVWWDSQKARYRWSEVTQDYAKEKLDPVRIYAVRKSWLDLFESAPSPAGAAPAMQVRWSPAVFFDSAQELQRRLAQWHVISAIEPIEIYSFLDCERVTRRTFRSAVMQCPHRPRPEPGLQFFPGMMTKEQAADGIAGTCFENLPSASDRTLTL